MQRQAGVQLGEDVAVAERAQAGAVVDDRAVLDDLLHRAEMMQKALTVFHTEFDKTASEDLPKV